MLILGIAVGLYPTAAFSGRPLDPPDYVGCLGFIQPLNGTITVGAQAYRGLPPIIKTLLVSEGDFVKAGTPLAVLTFQEEALLDLDIARAELAAIKAEHSEGITPANKHRVLLHEKRVEAAILACDRATVRAPAPGRILSIHSLPGETVYPPGILTLADLREVCVEAEIPVDDAIFLRPGQEATVLSHGYLNPLTGKVLRLRKQVGRPSLESTDPAAFRDRRVVTAFLSLPNPNGDTLFLGQQVQIRIHIAD